jgi:AcrR family transcriptional regulator
MNDSGKRAARVVKKTRKTPSRSAPRRTYNSPLRQQQAAETRDRIVAAGARIAHRLPAWDWKDLTFKAVGDRAGVSERTVHRHFSSERKLRDAVLQQLVQESGVQLDGLELGDFAGVAAGVYRYLLSFKATAPTPIIDPTFAALDEQRRLALLGAVARSTPQWSASEREVAAAALDMLWNPYAYERLSTGWHFDAERATRAIDWVVGLVESAIREGQRPKS